MAVFQSVLTVTRARQYPLNQSLDDASSSIIARQKRRRPSSSWRVTFVISSMRNLRWLLMAEAVC